MSIVLWLALAMRSLLIFLLRQFFKFFSDAARKASQKTAKFVEEKTKEHEIKNAQITLENWYEKASIVCGETVDALLNQKSGKSERIIRSLAAKLGFAGATAGLFSIASILGTASTGTAISTLSGAAFNSAALKWLGGGVSMALGGWVVFLFSVIAAAISYFIAKITFTKYTGKKRKLKNLDDQEKRVCETLMLIATGFRKQAEQMRDLDSASAAILHDKVFEQLSSELQKCIEKVADWPTIPRERLRKQAEKLKQLSEFLQSVVPTGRQKIGVVGGAERVDIVPVTVLKLMSTPVPPLNTQEKLVLEALRRTNKRKLKNSSSEILSEYVRLERIDRLTAQLDKVRRIHRKLMKRQSVSSNSDEYTVAFVEAPNQTGIEVLIQNLRTGEASMSKVHRGEFASLLADNEPTEINENVLARETAFGDASDRSELHVDDKESEILENLSIAAMITLAKSAGAYLSGKPISKNRQKQLIEDGVVIFGVSGLSQLIM